MPVDFFAAGFFVFALAFGFPLFFAGAIFLAGLFLSTAAAWDFLGAAGTGSALGEGGAGT